MLHSRNTKIINNKNNNKKYYNKLSSVLSFTSCLLPQKSEELADGTFNKEH